MNTVMARHIAAQIAELLELTSIFQTCYGKDYTMKPGSPAEAWELHDAILNQQVTIARLLDRDALSNPVQRVPPWWKWQETIDIGVVAQLAQEASQLIVCCASFEAAPISTSSPAVICAQRVIAGMLHPSALLMAQDEINQSKAS